MAIYITGDVHGDTKDPRWKYLDNLLNENDVLIITGDFGFDWNDSLRNVWLNFSHNYKILFCDGNHENFDMLNALPAEKMFGDEVGVFGNNTYRLFTGHMYVIEGKKFFVFGGAASIDKDWRVIEESKTNKPRTLWWPEEVPTEETFEMAKRTLLEHNCAFDYFISHTCTPQLKGPVLRSYKTDFFDPTESMINSLEYFIEENQGHFNHAFFGHFHRNVHFHNHHCLYGDIIDLNKGMIIKGFDDYSYETWETYPLDEGERTEIVYF